METGSLKTLARAVLERNRQGNRMEITSPTRDGEFPQEFPSPKTPTRIDGANASPWQRALSELKASAIPSRIPSQRWERLVADAERFVERWSGEAERNGWTVSDGFGCDPLAPLARLDHAGIVILIDGSKIIRITPDRIITRHPKGALLSIYGRRRLNPDSTVLLWHLPPARRDEP